MDYGLFTGIIDEASRFGSRSFSLHLFGEPLLYPRIVEAIEYIKRKRRDHTILLTTNGTLLNRYVDDLIRLGVDKLIWSWRPEAKFSDETKSKLRKWDRFTVRLIKETAPKEAVEEWSTWPKVEIRGLHNYGSNIDITKWQENGDAAKSLSQSSETAPSRWPCYHLWLAPAVAWNGEILICCSDPHRKEVLGRFPQDSIQKAWTGARLKSIRESHLEGKYGGICENCDVYKSYPDIFFSWQKQSSS